MAKRPVTWAEIQGFAVKEQERLGLLPKRRYVPVSAGGMLVRSRGCSGPTVGTGRVMTGEMVIPPPCNPPKPPSEDQRSLATAMKWAVKSAFREMPPITVQQSQVDRPGFENKRRNIKRVIVIHDTQPDGATALSHGFRGPFTSATPTVVDVSGFTPVSIINFLVPDSMVGIVESVLVTGQSIDTAAQVLLSAYRSGDQIQPEFNVVEGNPVPLSCTLGAGDTFTLAARIVGFGAFILKIELDIWLNPVAIVDRTLTSRVPKTNPSWARPQECV